jgi:hypothetical protein
VIGSLLAVVVGVALVAAGLALVAPPLSFVWCGAALITAGLFFDPERR